MFRRYLLAAALLLLFAAPLLLAEPPRIQVAHKASVRCLAWSFDGKHLITGAADGTLRILETATGQEVRTVSTGTAPIAAVAFSPDGKSVAVSQVGEKLSLWDVSTGKHLKSCPFAGYKADHVAFATDGTTVLGVAVNEFQQWRTGVGGSSGSRSSGTVGGCSAIAPDGSVLASADGKDSVRLREYHPASKFSSLRVGPATCMAVGPEGKLLAVGSEKGVQLWELPTQKLLPALPGTSRGVAILAMSADGHTLAGVSDDGSTVLVWDLKHHRLRRQLSHNRGRAMGLALSSDGKWLATIGLDGKAVAVWNATARELAHKGPPIHLTAADMATLWADLAHTDPTKADAAWLKFGAAGDNAVSFLKDRVKRIASPQVDRQKLEKLLADLDADQFVAREQASKQLLALGELAIAPLERLLENGHSLEAGRRAKLVLERLAQPVLTSDRLRVLEAIGLLEQVRSPGSLQLLQEIEREALIPQIRLEARQALQRITQTETEQNQPPRNQ